MDERIEIIGYKSSNDNSNKEIDEAAANIIKMIKEEIQNGKKPQDFAVISRTHAQLIPLEMACVKNEVPYYLGRGRGVTFLELPEIKTIQSYLIFINDFPERIDIKTDDSQIERLVDFSNPSRFIAELFPKKRHCNDQTTFICNKI